MRFVYAPSEIATAEISEAITIALEQGPVLLLVSGGSNILLAVNICNNLQLTNQLTLGLVDERYGPVGHPDSNWAQLLDAGLKTEEIHSLPVLEFDQPIETTSARYLERLTSAIDTNTSLIAIFGIGTDGHTSGILPNSPALKSTDIVTHFVGPDFPRITTTPMFMPFVHKAFLVSYGHAKHEQLVRLQEELPTSVQPAQALKRTQDLTVYSDYGRSRR